MKDYRQILGGTLCQMQTALRGVTSSMKDTVCGDARWQQTGLSGLMPTCIRMSEKPGTRSIRANREMIRKVYRSISHICTQQSTTVA